MKNFSAERGLKLCGFNFIYFNFGETHYLFI